MNNKTEIALRKHIKRIKKDIAERDPNSVWDKEKNKIDYKNIASLHEGRVPQYRDHGVGLPEMEMFEFDNLRDL
ncbi:hypothetical protein CMI37_15245 [Candidatus Pacearchaeota archaeon]|jgi:hypothetical protein|nr:hypothetical protein [Candidatus Pacearchaeota archaeon]|tara:strand:+ start:1387 stop:1608 length:222 start_codon:yes stop_codon:yes gene_type:complete